MYSMYDNTVLKIIEKKSFYLASVYIAFSGNLQEKCMVKSTNVTSSRMSLYK
jgi:hypothetical protein